MDLFIRNQQMSIPYGYLLTDCFWTISKVASDIVVFDGVYSIVSRHLRVHPSLGRVWDRPGAFMVPLLWILGALYICLNFSLAFVWLYFVDLSIIQGTAIARNGFEAALTCSLFVFIVLALCVTQGIPPSASTLRRPSASQDNPSSLVECTKVAVFFSPMTASIPAHPVVYSNGGSSAGRLWLSLCGASARWSYV